MSSSPWSRAGSPSVTLPPPPAPAHTPGLGATPPPAAIPLPTGFAQNRTRRRVWPWAALGLLLAIVISAATGSIVTLAVAHDDAHSTAGPSTAPSASPSAPAAPQVSAADAAAAKNHLCQVFDTSVRGQEGQGGLRVQGNLNVPVVLRGVNSASAVQNALTPAVPPDIADTARKYINATLDQTTAAMSNTPTPEVNRLTDVRNSATDAFADACGVPR